MESTMVEPPPPYTACRPPSYSEIDQNRIEAPRGLPRLQYAPGFSPRPSTNPFSQSSFSLVSWSTVHRNPARKQWENVARRRVQLDQVVDDLVSSLMSVPSPTSEQPPSPTQITSNPSTAADLSPRENNSTAASKPDTTPANPHEDPELVGPVAAERNRRQREYRDMIAQDRCRAQDAESRSWDFMLAQSADWQERQRSWDQFRQTKLGLGRSALLRSRR